MFEALRSALDAKKIDGSLGDVKSIVQFDSRLSMIVT
jgi:hypothetical protein